MAKITVNVKDSMGYSLNAGDTIAYPVRRGSKMWLETGKILAIGAETVGQGSIQVVAKVGKDNGSVVPFLSFSRCIKLN